MATPLGAELRAIRRALQLTQAEMAQRLGVHRVTLADWERGDPPPPAMALRLARFLGEVAPRPPPTWARPETDSLGLYLEPGGQCLWARHGGCGGAWYQLTAPATTRRHLSTEACEAHLWRAYDAVIRRIRASEARREAQQRRKAARAAQHHVTD